MKRHGILLLKYALALALLYWVLSQAGLADIGATLSGISPLWLIAAFMLFNLGQWASSERMRYYYRQAGYTLEPGFTLKLTYVSMFFNLLVPGGIGGDAYRVAILKKLDNIPLGTGVRLQFSNRASGLVVIMLFILLLMIASSLAIEGWVMASGLPLALAMLFGGYGFILLPILKESVDTAIGAFFWSVLVQGLGLTAAAMVCIGLGGGDFLTDYLLLYLLAQLAGMAPVTIGGLGLRELTFYYGAMWMQGYGEVPLQPELGVALSLACFGLTLAMALIGLIWVGRIRKTAPESA